MLTDEQIERIETALKYSGFLTKTGKTVELDAGAIEEYRQLIDSHRTLQQQNKQMKEALEETATTLKTAGYFPRLQNIISTALQGGTSNG